MKKYKKATRLNPEIIKKYHPILSPNDPKGTAIKKPIKLLDIHPGLIVHSFKSNETLTRLKKTKQDTATGISKKLFFLGDYKGGCT
jgi:hypothetical protein